ncbi:MAG: nitroreductase family protein [Lachnospiraceae bacterium]|nr:nitroreductase family protein [Lachnospiraceae bacterium]
MDFFEVVKKRYSHKEKFLPDPVPLEVLEKIAAAGLLAPNGMNMQCVHLVILPDREAVAKLCEIHPTPGLLTAPAAIAVLTDNSRQSEPPKNFELEDYSAAAENMLLAATALGYESLWLDSPYFDETRQKQALALLGASDNFNLRVVLPVGLPDGEGTRRGRVPFEERVFYGKFGQVKVSPDSGA